MKRVLKIKHLVLLIFLFSTLLLPVVSKADSSDASERIESFHSDIVINENSSMKVTETIKVNSAGEQIKHGIYRDFPTHYVDDIGNSVIVGFKVLDVKKDGHEEPYRVTNYENGKRIYIGDKNELIPPGEYTYAITYETNRQLGYFENYDSLYWNVTGNGWVFPIEQASATVTLPETVQKENLTLFGYTGQRGSQEKNLDYSIDLWGNAVYETTVGLGPYEGLSIVLHFPKGIVKQPSAILKTFNWIIDNVGTLIVLLGLIMVPVFYLYFWNKYGRDPKKGTIIPLYTPPQDLQPADIRYIRMMMYDNEAFTAAILNMAVKGYIRIEEEKKLFGKTYTISKTGESDEILSGKEKSIGEHLPERLELKNENYQKISSLIEILRMKEKEAYEGVYFNTNYKYLIIGIIISFAAIIIPDFLLRARTLLLISFPAAFILFLINLLFVFLMKAPTIEGRKLMDDIEGFKMFLSVTEKERLNLLNPPDKTPELFEKYLPYAVALGVEHKWAEQFSDVFERITATGDEYRPYWYSGTSWHTVGFASAFSNSFSSAISSSSTAPGSSSGGGGSGGGGGGGGGGGW